MQRRYLAYAFAGLLMLQPFTAGCALEATALGATAENAGVGMKVDAMAAALTASINLILTCNNKGMVYASNAGVAGRDADGCVMTAGAGGGDVASNLKL